MGFARGGGGGKCDMTIVQCITVIIFEKQRKNQLVVGRKNERDTLLTLVDGAREPVPLET